MNYPQRARLIKEFKTMDDYATIAERLRMEGFTTKRGKDWNMTAVAYTFGTLGLRRHTTNKKNHTKPAPRKEPKVSGKVQAIAHILRLDGISEAQRINLALLLADK